MYGLKAEKLEDFDNFLSKDLDYSEELKKLYNKFSSWEWIFGKKMEFQDTISKRFPWGEIDIHFIVNNGKYKSEIRL